MRFAFRSKYLNFQLKLKIKISLKFPTEFFTPPTIRNVTYPTEGESLPPWIRTTGLNKHQPLMCVCSEVLTDKGTRHSGGRNLHRYRKCISIENRTKCTRDQVTTTCINSDIYMSSLNLGGPQFIITPHAIWTGFFHGDLDCRLSISNKWH